MAQEPPQESRATSPAPDPGTKHRRSLEPHRSFEPGWIFGPGRIWLWLCALGLFLRNAYVLWDALRHLDLRMADFSSFFVAGKLFQSGLGHQLYDLQAQAQLQLSPRFQALPLPFVHAPYEAALFALLATLPYHASYITWNVINLGLLALMGWRLKPWIRSLAMPLPLILLLSLAFWPNIMVLLQGQDSILLAVLMTEAFLQLKQGRDARAGMILALGLFKFHEVIPLAICLAMNRQWKLLKYFFAVGGALAAASLAMLGSAGVSQFLHLLPRLQQMPLAIYIQPTEMPNLRGLFATLLHASPQLIGIAVVLSSALLVMALIFALPGTDRGRRFDLFFACAVVMSYALSYHSYEHDMAPVFPALLLAANAVVSLDSKGWKLACLACSGLLLFSPLYVYLYYHRLLSLMCIPVVLLIVVLLAAADRMAKQEMEAAGH